MAKAARGRGNSGLECGSSIFSEMAGRGTNQTLREDYVSKSLLSNLACVAPGSRVFEHLAASCDQQHGGNANGGASNTTTAGGSSAGGAGNTGGTKVSGGATGLGGTTATGGTKSTGVTTGGMQSTAGASGAGGATCGDTTSDWHNCGTCGHVCPNDGQYCDSNCCAAECP